MNRTKEMQGFLLGVNPHEIALPVVTATEEQNENVKGMPYEYSFTDEVGIRLGSSAIVFQNGHRNDPNASHGVTELAVLSVLRDRLKFFQEEGKFPSREGALAITKIEEAMYHLGERQRRRAREKTLGTYEK